MGTSTKKQTEHRVYRSRPSTLNQYLKAVESVSSSWEKSEGIYFRPWYRGQANTSWALVPSIMRNAYKILNEDNFRFEFKHKAFPYLTDGVKEPIDESERYFLMQHYGLPTRLLDWTESALVGLYFALRSHNYRRDAAVWMLDPWALNSQVAKVGDQLLSAADPAVAPYIQEPYSEGEVPEPPIAIYPSHKSRRITAQKGTFTLHGTDKRSLHEYARLRRRLIKIEIPKEHIYSIKYTLRRAGFTETSVFPELSGFCRELVDQWNDE